MDPVPGLQARLKRLLAAKLEIVVFDVGCGTEMYAGLPGEWEAQRHETENPEAGDANVITRQLVTVDPKTKDRLICRDMPTVTCSLCHRQCCASTAHRHQDDWVGACCWDERLRASE